MSLLFFHEPLALLNVPLYEYLGIAQIRVKEVLIFWCCNWHYAKICSTKPKKTEGCYRFAFWLLFDFCSFFSKYLLFVSFCSVLLFCCWCSCIVAWRGVVSVFVCVICFCVWFSLFVVAAFVLCYIYGVFPHGCSCLDVWFSSPSPQPTHLLVLTIPLHSPSRARTDTHTYAHTYIHAYMHCT